MSRLCADDAYDCDYTNHYYTDFRHSRHSTPDPALPTRNHTRECEINIFVNKVLRRTRLGRTTEIEVLENGSFQSADNRKWIVPKRSNGTIHFRKLRQARPLERFDNYNLADYLTQRDDRPLTEFDTPDTEPCAKFV